MINLMLGDCTESMKTINSGSVDMVFADLPYGTTQNKWDIIIPFQPLWEQLNRVLKENGAAVFTSMQPFTSLLVTSNIDNYKCDYVWKKPRATGHLNAKKQPLRNKEDIIVFYRKQPTYNPQFTEGKPYSQFKAGKDHASKSSMTDNYGSYTNFRNANDGFRYPLQILEFNVVQRGTVHPNQKPVDLISYFVRTYSNPRDIVLDPCMGSGSTGEACLQEERSFIGIEKDQKYYDIAEKRILGTRVPTSEQGSPNEIGYVGPKKLYTADGRPIDPAICQV
jgi:DNA modification methylase